jgi:hypothetical protein
MFENVPVLGLYTTAFAHVDGGMMTLPFGAKTVVSRLSAPNPETAFE